MDFGFLRVAAVVPKVNVADCEYNVTSIIESAKQACCAGAKVLVFPELCVTAYTCGDLFAQTTLIASATCGLEQIRNASASLDCVIVVGAPLLRGASLYDCAVVISKGRYLGVVPKIYNTVVEKRWFESGAECLCGYIKISSEEVPFGRDLIFVQGEAKIAIEIGEDLFAPISPSVIASVNGANVLLNLSASSDAMGKYESLKKTVESVSARCIAGYVYASAGYGESTTDFVYSGKTIVAENGALLAEGHRFSLNGTITIADVDVQKINIARRKENTFNANSELSYREIEIEGVDLVHDCALGIKHTAEKLPFIPAENKKQEYCSEVIDIQVAGLVKRLQVTGIKSVVLGVSGGLDSTLALLVCHKAFECLGYDVKGVVGITMPGFGTTGRTYNNALNLMSELGITQKEISIKKSVLQHFEDIGHDVNVHDVTYENSQARERTQILMDYANRCNGLVLGTGDMSELALGWATYNGDHMSMYGVNAGIPKTLVQELVRWFAYNSENEKVREILLDIVDTPISPELMPSDDKGNITQKTEDLVGPYELHDFFLFNVLKYGFTPSKIYFLAKTAFEGDYDDATIKKWLHTFYRRFFTQQFKRSCLPDGPKTCVVGLSPRGEWQMPSDATARLWLEECDKIEA